MPKSTKKSKFRKKSIQENSRNFLNIATPEEKKWVFDRSQSGFSVHFGSFMVQKGAREEMGHDPKNDPFLEKRRHRIASHRSVG